MNLSRKQYFAAHIYNIDETMIDQAAGTVFSWLDYQECRRRLHTEILTEHCQHVYTDVQAGNYVCLLLNLWEYGTLWPWWLNEGMFAGGREDTFTNVQAARDVAWRVPGDEAVPAGREGEPDRSSVADTSAAAPVKHPCKSKFSEKGVFLVDYCFDVGVVLA